MKKIEIYVDEDDNKRLDFYLTVELDGISRTRVQSLIKDNYITVNGSTTKPSYMVKEGDNILVLVPELKTFSIKPENIPIEIVYEDSELAVINKRDGMVVHPAPGNYEGTLVNALMFRFDKLSFINGITRPGIVHRLDKDTSGLMVIAKTDQAYRSISEQLKHHRVLREYYAIVHGNIKNDSGVINKPIGRNKKDRKKMAVTEKNSREAITHYNVLKRFGKYTLVSLRLETGRTHQIRVHLLDGGNPIVGDQIYSTRNNEFSVKRQLLHAKKLGFYHPTKQKFIEFECNLPEDFERVLKTLESR